MTSRPEEPAPEQVAALLRERIYGGIACLSTLLILGGVPAEESSAWSVVLDLVVATGSLWAASLLADVVAHLGAHGALGRTELIDTVRASGQILEAAVVPVVLLVAAAAGLLRIGPAVRIGTWVSVITLGLFALLAVRRTTLARRQRALLVAALLGLGALVVALKTLAH